MTRTLVVQSILYENEPGAIVRSVEATANSASRAAGEGVITDWRLMIGDCSAAAALDAAHQKQIDAIVRSVGGEFGYTVFGANLGHGGGHNRLAPLTESDLILVLNPDALLGPDSIAHLARAVGAGIGVADGRQLPLEHPKDYDPVTGDESWASGACSMTPRAVFDTVGGFDEETFFMYCDDVDYSWRVKLSGSRVVYCPAARVFHDKRLTMDAGIVPSAAEVYFSAEAAVLLAHKYSRPEIAKSILDAFRAQGDEVSLRVVQEYERRARSGTLPTPLDRDHAVAQFVNGNYAPHRF